MSRFLRSLPAGRRHLEELAGPLAALHDEAPRLEQWGRGLADVLARGGRLLAAGNGGSASQAAHLTSELVGRYRDDRPAFSAIALAAEASACTAIGNDYGIEEVFARQVRAHGRPGDILLALSTSGRSPNVLAAIDAARECGVETWGVCGAAPNPLAERCDDAVCLAGPTTATVQELHLVALHMLCAAVDREVALPDRGAGAGARERVHAAAAGRP